MGGQDDEYFLVEFSDTPRIVMDFTTDVSEILSRLMFTQAKGNTALYDALYLGLEKAERGSNSRKALLLITDGQDNHSRYSLSDLSDFARENDVSIYSIGITDERYLMGPGFSGKGVLKDLSTLTGGLAFFPKEVDALAGICQRIAVDLKSQYTLGYRPLNVANDGKWRKIKVSVKRPKGMPPVNVSAKSGYFASAADRR
jgi:Ca-activated chloride channel family protein